MARPPIGHESVALAMDRLRLSDSAREMRVCLAVILPTEQGMSIKDTANLLGRSPRWVSHVRKSFIEQGLSTVSANFGGRRTANMSMAEEKAFFGFFQREGQSRWYSGSFQDSRQAGRSFVPHGTPVGCL